MSFDQEQRLAALERRVAALERQMASRDVRSNGLSEGKEDSIDANVRLDEFFDDLLAKQMLTSYSHAYRALIGPYKVWLNAVHVPKVIALAQQSSWRQAGRLTIQLDALIVGKTTRRPGDGHFAAARYSEADWMQTFGAWPTKA